MNTYVNTIVEYMKNDDEMKLESFMDGHMDLFFDESDFYELIDSFSIDLRQSLEGCVNICGSGGSGLIKPNISSIASLYIALVGKIDVVKSGSVSKTSVCGSTNFFKEIGLLGYKNKQEILAKYHWGYCDRLELSWWKNYKNILSKNVYLSQLIKSHVVHDYRPKLMLLGLARPEYVTGLQSYIGYHTPQKIIMYYTLTNQGYIDEIAPGIVFIGGTKYDFFSNMKFDYLSNREDVGRINMGLLKGTCESEYWVKSLVLTVAVALYYCGYLSDIKEIYDDVYKAYANGGVLSFVNKIKKDCMWEL